MLCRASGNLGLTPEEVKAKGLRIGTINLWRPLRGPVVDCPLAVMDARGLRTEDCTITNDKFGDGTFIAAVPGTLASRASHPFVPVASRH